MMLGNQTPVTYRPPGYQLDLDRIPPKSGTGCGRIALLGIVGIVTLILTCGGIYAAVKAMTQQPQSETQRLTLAPTRSPAPTATAALTLDAWSLTGTALIFAAASPTTDYCWFLRPSPIPSFTPVPVTPDAWALQGTAYALQTGTPAFTPYPTQPPPRAWCDMETATFTPYPLPALPVKAETTEEAAPVRMPPTPQPRPTEPQNPTSTLFPSLDVYSQQPTAQVYQPRQQ